MNTAVNSLLISRGYDININAYDIINTCDDWYRSISTDQHKRQTISGEHYELQRMNFAKRVCADDANLCEVIEIANGNNVQNDFINKILEDNKFDTQYRKQLELTSAEGLTACYVRIENADIMTNGTLQGGEIKLNYIEASGFIPLTIVNDDIIEAAFVGETFKNTKKETTLVLCTIKNGIYQYETHIYDENNVEITPPNNIIVLGEVKPFSIMRTAEVNALIDMQGFGYPKIWSSIPYLLALDGAFTALFGDIDTSEKIVLINEFLCGFDEVGKPIPPNAQMKRRFVSIGEKLPQDGSLVHEIVPEIRVEKFENVIELLLSLLSMQFGYGTKKYSFDGAQITTATEYIGERQDQMQELNKQRYQAKQYIDGIVKAVLWFGNVFHKSNWDLNAETLISFDDSYIEDKTSQLESMRNDVLSGIGGISLKIKYLAQKYMIDEKEAIKWANDEIQIEDTNNEDSE